MRKFIRTAAVAATVGAAGLCAGAAPAGATPGASFDGSCSFADLHAHTDKPFLVVPRQITLTIDGPGTCTGTVGGASVTNAPVSVRAVTKGRSSTIASDGPLVGTASIDLGGGKSIDTDISVVLSAPITFAVVLTGASGTAHGGGVGHALETVLRPLPKIVGLNSQDGWFGLSVRTDGALVSK